MAASSPGNANLPIGDPSGGTHRRANTEGKNAIQENGAPRWHSRGYLPHFESAQAIQHVTFHLADSLPQSTLRRFEEELKFLPPEKRDAQRRNRIDAWIDAGHGSCILRDPRVAAMVQASLLFFDAQRYRLLAWVVMPNHVHTLFQPLDPWSVAAIVASWKKFTARRIRDRSWARQSPDGQSDSWERQSPDWRRVSWERRSPDRHSEQSRQPACTPKPVWAREYWDRYIRDEQHFQRTISYIHSNPVRAGLVPEAERWPWSSAFPGHAHPPGNANLSIGDFRRKP